MARAKVVWSRSGYVYGPRTSLLLRRQIWPAPMAIFTKRCCKWLGISWDILIYRGINRVVRYIWRKYIITVVIAKRSVAQHSGACYKWKLLFYFRKISLETRWPFRGYINRRISIMPQNGFIRAGVSSILKFCVQNFHLLCPGSGDRQWLGWGSVLTPGGSRTRELWRFRDGIVQCSWIWPAPMAIFTKRCCKWLGISWDILIYRGINRVVRYIWRKYIITVVIAKRNVA